MASMERKRRSSNVRKVSRRMVWSANLRLFHRTDPSAFPGISKRRVHRHCQFQSCLTFLCHPSRLPFQAVSTYRTCRSFGRSASPRRRPSTVPFETFRHASSTHVHPYLLSQNTSFSEAEGASDIAAHVRAPTSSRHERIFSGSVGCSLRMETTEVCQARENILSRPWDPLGKAWDARHGLGVLQEAKRSGVAHSRRRADETAETSGAEFRFVAERREGTKVGCWCLFWTDAPTKYPRSKAVEASLQRTIPSSLMLVGASRRLIRGVATSGGRSLAMHSRMSSNAHPEVGESPSTSRPFPYPFSTVSVRLVMGSVSISIGHVASSAMRVRHSRGFAAASRDFRGFVEAFEASRTFLRPAKGAARPRMAAQARQRRRNRARSSDTMADAHVPDASVRTLVVAGSANADVYCEVTRLPLPGETVDARGYATRPGGKVSRPVPTREHVETTHAKC